MSNRAASPPARSAARGGRREGYPGTRAAAWVLGISCPRLMLNSMLPVSRPSTRPEGGVGRGIGSTVHNSRGTPPGPRAGVGSVEVSMLVMQEQDVMIASARRGRLRRKRACYLAMPPSPHAPPPLLCGGGRFVYPAEPGGPSRLRSRHMRSTEMEKEDEISTAVHAVQPPAAAAAINTARARRRR